MAKTKGQVYGFYRWNGSAFQLVGATRQKTLTRSRTLIDAMNDEAADDAVFVPGARSGTVQVSGLLDADNTVQELLQDDFESGTVGRYRLASTTVGSWRWTFYGWVESFEVGTSTNELNTFSVTLQTEGAVVRDVAGT